MYYGLWVLFKKLQIVIGSDYISKTESPKLNKRLALNTVVLSLLSHDDLSTVTVLVAGLLWVGTGCSGSGDGDGRCRAVVARWVSTRSRARGSATTSSGTTTARCRRDWRIVARRWCARVRALEFKQSLDFDLKMNSKHGIKTLTACWQEDDPPQHETGIKGAGAGATMTGAGGATHEVDVA